MWAAFPAVLLVVAVGCRATEDAAAKPGEKPILVETAAVAAEDVDVVVKAVGTIEAEQVVKVQPKRAGRVLELQLAEGVMVWTGTVLARLDDRDLRARVDQARANVVEAEVRVRNVARQHDRTRELRDQGIAAQQQYDDLKAELDGAVAALDVARANLAFAEAQLAETVITAPFDGVIGRKLVDVGAFVKEGEALTTLVDADPVEVVFAVPERHLPDLQRDQAVAITVASYADRSFPGTVTFVDPEVDPVNRTVTVKAVAPNPDLELRPGQFATVTLTLAHHAGAAVVPEEALVPSGEQVLVYVVQDGRAAARPVDLGVRLPGRVEIRSGLAPGDVVVRTGHEKLRLDAASPVRDAKAAREG